MRGRGDSRRLGAPRSRAPRRPRPPRCPKGSSGRGARGLKRTPAAPRRQPSGPSPGRPSAPERFGTCPVRQRLRRVPFGPVSVSARNFGAATASCPLGARGPCGAQRRGHTPTLGLRGGRGSGGDIYMAKPSGRRTGRAARAPREVGGGAVTPGRARRGGERRVAP